MSMEVGAHMPILLNSLAKGKSWAKDLIKAASRLPFHCPVLVLTRATSVVDVTEGGMRGKEAEQGLPDPPYLTYNFHAPQVSTKVHPMSMSFRAISTGLFPLQLMCAYRCAAGASTVRSK
jgi:hypothetical protein